MSRRAIALARPRVHHEALDWARRVVTNGGSVSQSTMRAVSTFCDAIERAGIRDRFYRLNLFCGTGLSACLVPLYRGQTFGGAAYGSTTDTNNNFVSGDYAETGASGGLKGNGTTKFLNTGLNCSSLSLGDRHISVYEIAKATTAYSTSIGNRGTSALFELDLESPITTYTLYASSAANAARDTAYTQGGAHFVGSQAATTSSVLFKNGSSAATGATNATTAPAAPIYVLALRNGSITSDYSSARIGAYSIGLSMSSGQALAYYSAMQAFQTALARQV